MWAALGVFVVVVMSACGTDGNNSGSPDTGGEGSTSIRYEVRLRDGGNTGAVVEYRLPSGELESEEVDVPWSSDPLTFREGDLMLIRADADRSGSSPLLCALTSTDPEQGSYVLASPDQPFSTCETEYELGIWPPDDDDPIGNPLIRVG